MEALLLKELNFGLQKRTGPSSGIVPSIVLVSLGLDCLGVSLAEVCANCLIKNLNFMLNTEFFISTECPFHTLSNNETEFQYHIL